MKKYFLYLGQQMNYKHPAPERTAMKRPTDWLNKPNVFQVWPNRESMARSIRMQEKRAPKQDDWTPIVKLSDGEGF